jgi:hypothetical protein
MTYEIYLYIQRGLFERHKLLFALMLANKVLQSAGSVKAADIDVFLKGGGALDITSVRKKPKDWIPDGVWLSIIALSQMDSFRDLPDSVFRNDGLWKQWCAPLHAGRIILAEVSCLLLGALHPCAERCCYQQEGKVKAQVVHWLRACYFSGADL